MSANILFILNPTQAQISTLNTFTDNNWGESIHEGDTTAQFFATPDSLVELFVDDVLVSGMQFFFRKLEFNEKQYRFFGIGGVVTHVEYRHRGFATQVLNKAIERFHKDFDFAMLCTDVDRLGTLYGRVGFVSLDRPYYFVDKNGIEQSETGGMIAPLSSPLAVRQILKTSDKIFVGVSNF